jgi:hypothetical protein
MGIHIDTTASHNHPDITLFNKIIKKVYIIDVSIPNLGDMQTACKEKKIRKYAELSTE